MTKFRLLIFWCSEVIHILQSALSCQQNQFFGSMLQELLSCLVIIGITAYTVVLLSNWKVKLIATSKKLHTLLPLRCSAARGTRNHVAVHGTHPTLHGTKGIWCVLRTITWNLDLRFNCRAGENVSMAFKSDWNRHSTLYCWEATMDLSSHVHDAL